MKKFKCVVTRVDEYEIELDEEKINKEWMDGFRLYMYNFHDYEEHAKHIAQLRARYGEGFYEGYGYISVNGEPPLMVRLNEENIKSYQNGININIISEDEYCEVEIEEIEK